MKIPLLALILQGIPESIAIVTLAYVIAKMPFAWKKIVPMGILLATSSYVLRFFSVTFGIHTVILMVLLLILLIFWGKGNIIAALIASLISYLAVIIAETFCLGILMPVFQVTPEMLSNNIVVRILITLPQVFVLFVLAFVIFKIRTRKKVS